MKKNTFRQVLLIVVSILNWIFSVGLIRSVYKSMISENKIQGADNVTIDGSDFTPLADLAVEGLNGLIDFLVIVSSVFFTTVFILIFAIILKKIAIRKKDVVEEAEVIFARRFIIISSVLAFVAGVLVSNINLNGVVLSMSWQQPLFMMLIYYLSLKKRFVNGVELD